MKAQRSAPNRLGETGADAVSEIEEQAAGWFLRRSEGLSTEQEREFRAWLAKDPRNGVALAELEATWAEMNHPRQSGHGASLVRALDVRATRRGRRRRISAAAVAGLVAAAAWMFAIFTDRNQPSEPTVQTTIVLRPDRRILADGSTVELSSSAQIIVDFSEQKRGVTLLKGDAMFIVEKDAKRPFVVTANQVEVRAVGTAFAVCHESMKVDVLVTEGRVAVDRLSTVGMQASAAATARPVSTYLNAGSRLSISFSSPDGNPLRIEPLTRAELDSALAWRGKRVEFTGTSVAEAVELFNRQNQLQLSVTDQAVNNLQLTGVFWADDPEGFVRLLSNGMKVQITRTGNSVVLRGK
jgi:transmembrane sensor